MTTTTLIALMSDVGIGFNLFVLSPLALRVGVLVPMKVQQSKANKRNKTTTALLHHNFPF